MKTILFLLVVFFGTLVNAQQTKILFFKNKQSIISLDNSIMISPRSVERRARQGIKSDSYDAPLNEQFIQQLSETGTILNTSKWLNAVSYSTDLSEDELKNKFDFIERIHSIEKVKPTLPNKHEAFEKSLNYGNALAQMEQINLKCLHDLGYTGQGMYVGVIDVGFRNMKTNGYFDIAYSESRILDTFNFVNPSLTVYDRSGHGTTVSSAIVGEKAAPDEYAGTGVDVELALYLSEDDASETEIEEFNLVAALERCDSVGVDVVNISLGYFDFDDPLTSHVYADLDGVTTIAAQGVNVAKGKGMFVAVSAGNSGPSNISTPCDADGAFCVGAVDEFGVLADFSSVGPSADGQVKPDVVARGKDAWLIDEWGSTGQGNGTSFSSPIIAGATACLIQANPSKSVQEVMDAIRQSSSQYASPDEFKGYGIPDFCVANDLLQTDSGLDENKDELLLIYPIPAKDVLNISGFSTSEKVNVFLYNGLGKKILSTAKTSNDSELKIDVSQLYKGVYTLHIFNESRDYRKKVILID